MWIDYDTYAAGRRLLYLLLAPATVALAVPMSRHVAVARDCGPALLVAVACGSGCGLAVTIGVASGPRP